MGVHRLQDRILEGCGKRATFHILQGLAVGDADLRQLMG
jgi:hypothetical protein